MDTFMDKLAEKLNAEEIIQANRAADIDQKIQKKQQEELAVLKEEFARLQEELAAVQGALVTLQGSMGKMQKSMETLLAGTNDHVHKENVKVYRNVQAVVVEESVKQAESIRALAETVEMMKREAEEAAEAATAKKTPAIWKGILGVGIVTMLLTAGLVTVQILTYLGILAI